MDRLPAGPYRFVTLRDGRQAPWYLIPFDEQGGCEGPATQAALVADIAQNGYTDVFLFSHGWNNNWADANKLYDGWLAGFIKLLTDHDLSVPREFRPLFAGVIWPSTALVFPGESAPQFAGQPADPNAQVDGVMEIVRTLARAVGSSADRARLYELAQRDRIVEAEAADLARILAPVYATRSDDLVGEADPPTPAELLAAWKAMAADLPQSTPVLRGGNFGFARDEPASPAPAAAAGPQAASFSWSDLDPRWIYRVATVYQMKDRAGVVGSLGVKPMLDAILAANPADDAAHRTRLHLLGHSYGGKVMLSALCHNNQTGAPKVDSLLLLEPAVSYLCFAANVDGRGTPGGYVAAPGRVRQPILSTYSSADVPLTRFFHLALRRASDLGDQRIAGVPPSRYAALGGFGPADGPGVTAVDIITDIPNTRYALAPGNAAIIGVNGSPDAAGRGIHGHGDVSNPFTYWMLFNQVTEAATG